MNLNKERLKRGKGTRWGNIFLAGLLLIPGLFLTGSNSKVEGAALTTIVKVENLASYFSTVVSGSYYDPTDTFYNAITLSDGSKYYLNGATVFATYAAGETPLMPSLGSYSSASSYPFLGADGYIYTSKSNLTKISATKFKTAVASTSFGAYFAIAEDGGTWAWGDGTSGQLGIGSKINRTIPAEVVDPATDAPIVGVKKIIQAPEAGVILLTDTKAYLVGTSFGLSSLSTAKPLLLSSFPAYTDPTKVNVYYLGNTSAVGTNYGKQYVANSNPPIQYGWNTANFRRYVLEIGGVPYTFSPVDSVITSDKAITAFTGLTSSPIDNAKVKIYPNEDMQLNTYTGIYLDGGVLSTWDTLKTRIPAWQPTVTNATTFANKYQIATGVDKAMYNNDANTYWYIKNGMLYAVGLNTGGISGDSSGVLTSPIRIRGASDQVAAVKDIAISDTGYRYYANPAIMAINSAGKLYSWRSSGTMSERVSTFGDKFVGFVETPTVGVEGRYNTYVIDDKGRMFYITAQDNGSISLSQVTTMPTVYPTGYMAPVVLNVPVVTSQTLDGYTRTTLTIDYGSDPGITVREYSLDAGATWNRYTAPLLITQSGSVSFQARSGDGTSYSPILSLNITNNPIVIPVGYPKVIMTGAVLTIDSGTIPADVTKIKIDIDGILTDYTGAITLAEGTHPVIVTVHNKSTDEKLAEVTDSVTVAPTATPTPTVTPTATPVPTVAPTATPVPTVTPTATPVPTIAPTATPVPTLDPSWGSHLGTEDINFTVLSGGFSSQFNGLLLDTVTISTTNQYQVINSVTNSVIEDSRGTGAGWNYTLKVTDFISDPVVDNSLGTNDLVVKMPSTALSVDVSNSTTLAGQDGNLSLNGNYVFNAEPVVLARAEDFHGMGQYQIPMSYMLRVPDKVEVVSAGNGSAYQAGAKTALRVGKYRSQLTFTLASGI